MERAMADQPEEMDLRREEWRAVVGRLIARAWADEDFKRALIADPHPHLHAEGLIFPESYTVEFYEDPLADLGDWSSVGRGHQAVHRFPIPPRPDQADLIVDLGGPDGGSVACCSPCASCTGAVSHQTWS